MSVSTGNAVAGFCVMHRTHNITHKPSCCQLGEERADVHHTCLPFRGKILDVIKVERNVNTVKSINLLSFGSNWRRALAFMMRNAIAMMNFILLICKDKQVVAKFST